ncbi:MAG: ATP-binding protein [Nitrospiraceae bacterium]
MPSRGSRAHILQVCLNIVMNAIDAMAGGGDLTVTLALDTRRVPGVLMRFSDSGKGIPAEDLKRIYEPFFTNGKAKGGAGAYDHEDIVERHQGQLVIQESAWQGQWWMYGFRSSTRLSAMLKMPPSAFSRRLEPRRTALSTPQPCACCGLAGRAF